MAKQIGVSHSYFSQLINGKNLGVSYETAYKICIFFDDWELFDVLKYQKPQEAYNIPIEFQNNVEKALAEASNHIQELALDKNSPEALQAIKDIFEKYGILILK